MRARLRARDDARAAPALRTALAERLAALHVAVELADGRLDPPVVADARVVAARADERLARCADCTVVALAGATGSGKSSLFNALAGSSLAAVGVRRPTTGRPQAAVWGDVEAGPLLDWLDVPTRQAVEADPGEDLAGLVLLDLPDHDSTEREHRLEVDRLVARVDLMVWVLDPQKYADAAVHEQYLRTLVRHEPVVVVVLNQADRLAVADRERCLDDLRRLLRADGLHRVPLLATSATTGSGLDQLREILAERVAARRAAVERLAADVETAAAQLRSASGGTAPAAPVDSRSTRATVSAALADAAGVPAAAAAVGAAYRSRAVLATGWPPTRWVRRLRPDPIRRLRLDIGAATRTSLPAPGPGERAAAEAALREAADAATVGLPERWTALARAAAARAVPDLSERLDEAVAGADLGLRPPRWWRMFGLLQLLLVAVVAVGLLWLAARAVAAWFALPPVPIPRVQGLEAMSWPTLLLIGGVLAGWLLALIARWLAASGAARRRARARARLTSRVEELADRLLAPVLEERRVYVDLQRSLDRALGQ